MLDRSGWTYKRMRLTTKWAVEIARQKVFGTRPICPIEVNEPKDAELCTRVLPERKAAVKAKERFKELLNDQGKGLESRDDIDSFCKTSSRKRKEVKHLSNSTRFNSDSNKNSKQRNMKLGRNKALRLSRKDKASIKKFKIKPCIVCIPALKDVRKYIQKLKEQNGGQSVTNVNTTLTGVNKRKTKKPLRIIKPGDSGREPIVLSDDDSDIECIEPNVTSLNMNQNSPIVLGYDSEGDDDIDIMSVADDTIYTDKNDPNDADTEEDGFDLMDNTDDSFYNNSDVSSDIEDNYNDYGNVDDNESNSFIDDVNSNNDDDDDDEYQTVDDDHDALTLIKAQNPYTYSGIRGKTLIAPATFQPSKFKVTHPKFSLPPSFRAGAFMDYNEHIKKQLQMLRQ